MEKLENIDFADNCVAIMNEYESTELNKYIAKAVVEFPIHVSSEIAENKKGFINTYNINISYGVRTNVGEAYVEIGKSEKVRGITPSLFGGMIGKGSMYNYSKEDSNYPFSVFQSVSKFLEFLKIIISGIGEDWSKFNDLLKGSGVNGVDDAMKTKAYKSKEFLEKSRDELNLANPGVEAKIPSDLFPKEKTQLLDVDTTLPKGMGLYKVFEDGHKEQIIDPNGVIANVLIGNRPSNTAIKIEPEVVGLLFVWLTSANQKDFGIIWGRWHMYEQQ